MNWNCVSTLTFVELKRRARSFRTAAAFVLFLAVLGVGSWFYWQALPPRPQDDRLFGDAYVLAALVALHAGIARDRRFYFDAFLANNILAPRELYTSKLCATVLCLLAASCCTFVVALAMSAGDVEYSAWYSIVLCLVALLFLPAVLLSELLLEIEYPVAIVALAFTALLSVAGRASGARRILDALALAGERFDYSNLSRLALRAFIAVAVTGLLYPLYLWKLDPLQRRTLQQ